MAAAAAAKSCTIKKKLLNMMISQFVFFFSLSFIDGAVNLKKKMAAIKNNVTRNGGKKLLGKVFSRMGS